MKGDNIEALISDFIYKYGERGRTLLEAMVRASNRISGSSTPVPGDFSYRSLVEELGMMGYSYNPSPLLRILEKEYALIKTTLHTSGQRWYVFSNKAALEEYVERLKSGSDDPEAVVIRLQLEALRISDVEKILKTMLEKKRWGESDYERLYKISFKILPKMLRIYKRVQEDPERWGDIPRRIEEIFNMASRLRSRAPQRREEPFHPVEREEDKIQL